MAEERHYKLIIIHPLTKLNEYINLERSNRYAAAKLKKQEQEIVCWLIKEQLQSVVFTAPVTMEYHWHEPSRRRDKDNCTFPRKVIQDALVEMGVLPNDGWNNIAGFTDHFYINKNNPRVEVVIKVAGVLVGRRRFMQ